MQLVISDDDARILREILTEDLGDLRMEIADTDQMDFREKLKRRETALNNILAVLPTPKGGGR